eukprot:jgi/Picsp_1/666/NSC_00661-R1_dynein light chain roadblock-type 1
MKYPLGSGEQQVDIADVEAVVQRLQSYSGVQGVLISNTDGIPIRTSTFEESEANRYGNLSARLIHHAESYLKDVFANEEVAVIRIRGKEAEIVIAPATIERESHVTLSVIQKLNRKKNA